MNTDGLRKKYGRIFLLTLFLLGITLGAFKCSSSGNGEVNLTLTVKGWFATSAPSKDSSDSFSAIKREPCTFVCILALNVVTPEQKSPIDIPAKNIAIPIETECLTDGTPPNNEQFSFVEEFQTQLDLGKNDSIEAEINCTNLDADLVSLGGIQGVYYGKRTEPIAGQNVLAMEVSVSRTDLVSMDTDLYCGDEVFEGIGLLHQGTCPVQTEDGLCSYTLDELFVFYSIAAGCSLCGNGQIDEGEECDLGQDGSGEDTCPEGSYCSEKYPFSCQCRELNECQLGTCKMSSDCPRGLQKQWPTTCLTDVGGPDYGCCVCEKEWCDPTAADPDAACLPDAPYCISFETDGFDPSLGCCVSSPANCGNQICEMDVPGGIPEDQVNCPEDCGTCGNKFCEPHFEDPDNCPEDCDPSTPAECGNGICEPWANEVLDCPQDCPSGECPGTLEYGFCGDGIDNDCDWLTDCADPQCAGISKECIEVCGNDICESDEDVLSCPEDCPCESTSPEAPYPPGDKRNYIFCYDGCDNDENGFIDCDDQSCIDSGICK